MNELNREKSPYLLQHKDNPVWWRAWSDKAFKAAKDRDRLIFLSIGYATCHWCHVMEHESFEDASVAQILNDKFISIKVDREELPDVDQIYMDAVHAMGQRGGWPLNMILTPDLRPIYGGTYFPKPHFIRLLQQLSDLWAQDREKVLSSADQVFQFLNQQTRQYTSCLPIEENVWNESIKNFKTQFDPIHGGFGEAPKFPPHTQLCYLGRLYLRTRDSELLNIYERTLKEMAKGGLYDHIGGGFTRYSVDERWEIPHFEKMLYVNSQCVVSYLEAYQITQNTQYLDVVRETLEYVMRDMMSSGSGFYSAEDADSETLQDHEGLKTDPSEHSSIKAEGAFYVWSYEELKNILSEEELKFSEKHLGVTEYGNFESKFNHLHVVGVDFWEPRQEKLFKSLQKKLFALRETRERPLLDDKQLTSWNALMILAMAKAFRVMDDKRYLEAALQSANFIRTTLWDGRVLYRRYREGERSFRATLDDYAYLIQALIELYQATFEESWLLWAEELQEQQNQLFWDTSSAGYFYTDLETKNLIVRTKDFGDNAIPSSNSVSAHNLIVLSHYFLKPDYRTKVEQLFMVVGEALMRFPSAFSTLLGAYDLFTNEQSQQLVIADSITPEIKKFLGTNYLPNLIIAIGGEKASLPLVKGKTKGYYLCRNGTCDLPETSWPQVVLKLKC